MALVFLFALCSSYICTHAASTGDIVEIEQPISGDDSSEGPKVGGAGTRMMERIHPNVQRVDPRASALPEADIEVQSPECSDAAVERSSSDKLIKMAKDSMLNHTISAIKLTPDENEHASDERGPMIFDRSRPMRDVETNATATAHQTQTHHHHQEKKGFDTVDKVAGSTLLVFLLTGAALLIWGVVVGKIPADGSDGSM